MFRESRSLAIVIALILIIVGSSTFIFKSNLYDVLPGNTVAQREEALADGLDAFERGGIESSRSSFEQAARMSVTGDERAQYEILVALTYERSDLSRSAEMYRAVMNNVGYSLKARGLAGTYLLLALGNQYAPAIAESVFSQEPWIDLYKRDTNNARINYEIALSRGYRWINENLAPNFLSLLVPGEFYARSYPLIDGASFQRVIEPSIPTYYADGARLLKEAQADGSSHPNLIASGLRAKAAYAAHYYPLIASGRMSAPKGSESDFSVASINATYTELASYTERLLGPIKNSMVLTGSLDHASFILSANVENAELLSLLAEKIASLLLSDEDSVRNVQVYGLGLTHVHIAYRETLLALARQTPQLKAALFEKTTSFTTDDFVAQ